MTSNWTVNDLASWLAHDLRTPLGAIVSFSEILLTADDLDPAAQREFLGIMHAEGLRLARMVEQAVRLVRLDREAADWAPGPVAAASWLADGQRQAGEELQALGLRVESRPPDESLAFRGAAAATTDALAYLLVGLGEFAGPGAPLRLAVATEPTGVVLTARTGAFRLTDDQAAMVFHPFQRLGNAPHHDPVATGLELALCAAIVAQQGGRAWARPEGEGVCFGVTLPLATPEQPLAAGEPSSARAERRSARSRHVLIVDDQPFIVRSLALALRRAGYQVSSAVDGGEGLEKIRQLQPGLVFLDVMMPVLDGFEVCQQVRADPTLADTCIIMLTAKGQAMDEERGRELDVDAYITKPFSPSAVVARVREILG